jgi:hypothetical protein
VKHVACVLTEHQSHYFAGDTEEECFRKIQAWRNRTFAKRKNGGCRIEFIDKQVGARFAVFNRFHPYNGF